MINVPCPCGCGQVFHADESQIGRKIRCPSSGYVLLIERPRVAPISKTEPAPIDMGPAGRIRPAAENIVGLKRKAWPTRIGVSLFILLVLAVAAAVYELSGPSSATFPSGAATMSRASRPASPSGYSVPLRSGRAPAPPSRQATPTPQPVRTPPKPHRCVDGKEPVQLYNGEDVIEPTPSYGTSEIKIINNSGTDAVVSLYEPDTGTSARAVYILAHSSYKISGIDPGSYLIRWESGLGWVPQCMDFKGYAGYGQSGKPAVVEQDAYYDTRGEVTLNPVINGNTRKLAIDRNTFLQGLLLRERH